MAVHQHRGKRPLLSHHHGRDVLQKHPLRHGLKAEAGAQHIHLMHGQPMRLGGGAQVVHKLVVRTIGKHAQHEIKAHGVLGDGIKSAPHEVHFRKKYASRIEDRKKKEMMKHNETILDSAMKKKMKQFLQLVDKSLEKSLRHDMPFKHKKHIKAWHIASNQTAYAMLNETHPAYFYKAKASQGYTKVEEDRLATKIYIGPCGVIQIFATRDDFDTSTVQFGYYPEGVRCEYNKSGPENQFLLVAYVPLRLCAACQEILVPKSYKCSRCKAAGIHARYCSSECQFRHWQTHKAVCGDTKPQESSKRESPLDDIRMFKRVGCI